MKSIFYSLILCLVLLSCGPAAEDREKMHARAKVFQDSIANVIKQAMAEAETPGPLMQQPQPAPQPTQAAPQGSPVPPNIGVNQAH